jgi:hypothetical protein
MPSFWRRDPGSLSPPGPDGSREIDGGRLFDLTALQTLLNSGDFDLDALVFGTRGARADQERNRWKHDDVLHMLTLLKEPAPPEHGSVESGNDYRKSEWCEVDAEHGRRWVPCDVYRMRVDLEKLQRHSRGTEVYFKFSVEDDGYVTIVMASCHPST